MANIPCTTVDDYIAVQPHAVRSVLELVRDTIRKAVPKAEEGISYNMPAYKLGGEVVLYFAGWKNHYSLYPITAPVIAAFKEEIGAYEVNNKGTMRMPFSEPVPVKLVSKIAKFRAKEIGEKR